MATSCYNCAIGQLCSCGKCHTCGYQWTYSHEGYACTFPNKVVKPKTQKAAGMWALRKHIGGHMNVAMPLHTLALDAKEKDIPVEEYPLFARPCPIQPRHGFVDSRVVKDWDELKVVLDETKAADPEGEVMLLKFIPSVLNAVLVPNLLTIGEGNDGATAGHNTITFPLNGIVGVQLSNCFPDANINPKKQDPYLEVVYKKDESYFLTQLRSGPKLEGSSVDYLPRTMEVMGVIKVDPKMDLLKWEELIEGYKDNKGVVVYHPGGSPADHFSVHARTYEIPVCITFNPKVGETITEALTVPLDPLNVLKGIVVGDMMVLKHNTHGDGVTDCQKAVSLLLHTLHHSGGIGGDQSWWLGVGVAFMLRYGTIALKGEARHVKSPYVGRDTVYAKTLPFPLQRQRASTPGLVNILRYGNFSGAVGGIKWAQCGNATSKLFDAVGLLAKDPSTDTVNGLVRAFNFAVNQAHNGGWWLNKFIASNAFNEIQHGELSYTLGMVPFLWRVKEFSDTIKQEDVDKRMKMWAKWVPISLIPPKLIKACIVTVPGISGLAISVEDKLLKKHHKPLIISIPTLVEKLPSIIKGKLYVETTDEGLQVLLQSPHEEPIVLWKEMGIDGAIGK